MNSASKSALDRGVVHLPDTSLPWSDTPERNVYLAGHRLGWPGTGSNLIFYRLNELTGGERVTLHGPNGKAYTYRVLKNFIVGPKDNWVTGRVKDRDLLTLLTCTPRTMTRPSFLIRALPALALALLTWSCGDDRTPLVVYSPHGRDLLTLQTCTPIPTFQNRLIVRAERV